MTAAPCERCGLVRCGDASVDCYAAEMYLRMESEQCLCDPKFGPSHINDDCPWHGDRIWREIDRGEFWHRTATPAGRGTETL